MAYRKIPFVNNEIYHITIRAIDNNLIFKNDNDYYRGIFSIYEFNNTKPATIQERRKTRIRLKKKSEKMDRGRTSIQTDEREKLVEIICFVFMPNHIHLLLKQIQKGGISRFMKKLGTGYGGYFNRKYDRKGYVFQNRFFSNHIKKEEQLKIAFAYIHINPSSLVEPKWKEEGIKKSDKVIKFLEEYKWSSYQDYIDKNNFPSVTDRDIIIKTMGGQKEIREFIRYWIKTKSRFTEFSEIE